MGNLTEKLVFFAAVALFITAAMFLVWRESAQVNLKSGMALYEQDGRGALEILRNGVRKDPHDYLLHYGVARTLHKAGFDAIRDKKDGKELIFEARRTIREAMALRFDSFGYQLLAFNNDLAGEAKKALAYHNISFFFSQNSAETSFWEKSRPLQAGTAGEYFAADKTGVSLIMAYNALVGYEVRPASSAAEQLLGDWFLSTQPSKWLAEAGDKGKRKLKELYNQRTDPQRQEIVRLFDSAGFSFLARFLGSQV